MRYRRIEDGEGVEIDMDKEVLRIACCDCGLVHTFAFAIEDNENLGIAMRRESRATAQLRRHGFGNLHKGSGKWKIERD